MTPEEIKTLIDQKIAGQGTMVDVGGALPTILKEIVDMAGQGGGGAFVPLAITTPEEATTGTKEEVATALGITQQDIDDIFDSKIAAVKASFIVGDEVEVTMPLEAVVKGNMADAPLWYAKFVATNPTPAGGKYVASFVNYVGTFQASVSYMQE